MKARDRKGVNRYWKRLVIESDKTSKMLITKYVTEVLKRPKVKRCIVNASEVIPEQVLKGADYMKILANEKDRLALNIGRRLMEDGMICFDTENANRRLYDDKRIKLTASFTFYEEDVDEDLKRIFE